MVVEPAVLLVDEEEGVTVVDAVGTGVGCRCEVVAMARDSSVSE